MTQDCKGPESPLSRGDRLGAQERTGSGSPHTSGGAQYTSVRLAKWTACVIAAWAALAVIGHAAPLDRLNDASALRLVPFPKEARLEEGGFELNRRLVLEVSQRQAEILASQLTSELTAAGYAPPSIRHIKTAYPVLRLSTKARLAIKKLPLREGATPEDYALQIQPNAISVIGAGPAGLFYGVQTLRQLIRCNRQGDRVPALSIRDWPALGWRAFQDDLTRGPSSTIENLKSQAALGAYLKLNIFTSYMEHQFAFKKHPEIGPKGGSLTPDELKQLVSFSEPLQLNILGNQQSFGHFGAILAHPQYAALRETPDVLCPTQPGTYRLLDDLYSEEIPLLPFSFFNVCCDETDGLGQGPSKPLADRIGTGAVYVEHIRRVHDLIQGKYQKRMMMWGDIILRHPEHLSKIPRDTIMLTWAYDPRTSFQDQILPFSTAGYDFFVCPGANGWNRILPAFGAATTNIQQFVQDGIAWARWACSIQPGTMTERLLMPRIGTRLPGARSVPGTDRPLVRPSSIGGSARSLFGRKGSSSARRSPRCLRPGSRACPVRVTGNSISARSSCATATPASPSGTGTWPR